jgi:hypothetical protein
MKTKPILITCAIAVFIFASGYIIFPSRTLSMLGFATDTTGLLIVQFVGVLSMGYAVSIWKIRDEEIEKQKPILYSAFVSMGFAFLVSLYHQLSGSFGSLGWLGVGMFALAFSVFGYYSLR